MKHPWGRVNTKHFIESVDYIKDLGVTFDSHLSFYGHIQEKINKAYSRIGLINRNFIYMDKNTFCLLYKALVRPHVKYAHSVWYPYKNVILLILRRFKKEPLNL